ncbi:MAG: pilus assembly protein [Agathobacter sp.]|nr:pilus assembly protein [Agathobacter sp.]
MNRLKGSFTIEAVIIIPMMLFMIIAVLEQGIQFYKESAEREVADVVTEWDAVSVFYDFWILKELGDILGDD